MKQRKKQATELEIEGTIQRRGDERQGHRTPNSVTNKNTTKRSDEHETSRYKGGMKIAQCAEEHETGGRQQTTGQNDREAENEMKCTR
jgi:hypothetical protein